MPGEPLLAAPGLRAEEIEHQGLASGLPGGAQGAVELRFRQRVQRAAEDHHVGTHLDARKHIVPDAGGPETIPLEYCVSDGVLLDFTAKAPGDVISVEDVQRELDRISYQLKERDIVLNHTGAGAYNTE